MKIMKTEEPSDQRVNEVLESIFGDSENIENLPMRWLGTQEEFKAFSDKVVAMGSPPPKLRIYAAPAPWEV